MLGIGDAVSPASTWVAGTSSHPGAVGCRSEEGVGAAQVMHGQLPTEEPTMSQEEQRAAMQLQLARLFLVEEDA